MKKLNIRRRMAVLLTVVFVLSLTACANREKKMETIAIYNETAEIFNEVVGLINDNSQLTAADIVDVCVELSDTLKEYEESLDSEEILEEEEYDAMILHLNEAKAWAAESKQLLEELLAEGN